MLKTNMEGLNDSTMQAVVDQIDYTNDFYYPRYFPLRQNQTLTWKTLSMQTGLRLAADVVARGATIDPKSRQALRKIQGEIPKIAVRYEMDEDTLTQYRIMQATSRGDARKVELVRAWAEDTERAVRAVATRIEWMAMQQLSLGKIDLTKDNNPMGVVTENTIDANVKYKLGVSNGSWSDATNAKPLDDLKKLVKDARKNHLSPKFCLMSLETFNLFASTKQVMDFSASYQNLAFGIQQLPSVDEVNRAMQRQTNFYGLQIRVIDTEISIEQQGGGIVSLNPFEDNVCTLVENLNFGYTYWMTPADLDLTGSVVVKSIRDCTLIKRYAEESPIREITEGIANAFPAWITAQRSILVDTENSTWKIA